MFIVVYELVYFQLMHFFYPVQHGQFDVMDDCVKMFFQKTPPSNQFLCRAYLCQAQLNAPTSSKNPVSFDFIPIITVTIFTCSRGLLKSCLPAVYGYL